jgi:Ca2+-dependent lipid-binding protein
MSKKVLYVDDYFIDVIIISGHFLHNHSTFSNMDPYIAFEHNGRIFKTTVKKKAGVNATWNERFRLKPLKDPNEIFI